MEQIFDVIIVGGGPCGLSAGVYAGRSGLKTLLIERFACGGQILNTFEIKNYPGFLNISGHDLAQKMQNQIADLGVKVKYETVVDFDFSNYIKVVKTKKNSYFAKTIILALGAKPKTLGLKNEAQFVGKGVSYCSICDGAFFKNKVVAMVGGGNSAIEDIPYLTNLASKAYLINRSKKYKAQQVLLDNLQSLKDGGKLQVLEDTIVTELVGQNILEAIKVKNVLDNSTQTIKVDGLFVEIGRAPDTQLLAGKLELDSYGYIVTDANLSTSIKGVFAGGDAVQKSLRQIVTASSDGAICATSAFNFLQKKLWRIKFIL